MRPLLVIFLLTACSGGQDFDQDLHYLLGYGLTCDMIKWAEPEVAIEHTMDYARSRENLQHPGECGSGCQEDLENWKKGAEDGALCGRR